VLDLSPDKLLMLAVVALVVLGPNRLPGAARSLGRFLGQMRAMSSSFQTEVRDAIHEPHQAFTSALGDLRPADIRRNVRRVVVDTLSPPTGPDTAGANQDRPESTNLAPGSASASSPGPGTELSDPPSTGRVGPAPPDDPGFN
jgi:sec-independent protein translocase protein TatB